MFSIFFQLSAYSITSLVVPSQAQHMFSIQIEGQAKDNGFRLEYTQVVDGEDYVL